MVYIIKDKKEEGIRGDHECELMRKGGRRGDLKEGGNRRRESTEVWGKNLLTEPTGLKKVFWGCFGGWG